MFGKRCCPSIEPMNLGNNTIEWAQAVKYLEHALLVVLDLALTLLVSNVHFMLPATVFIIM